jgi:hypothetical protein
MSYPPSRFTHTTEPRTPVAGEVWTHHILGDKLAIVWADDKTVLYEYGCIEGVRDALPTKDFIQHYVPPKPKLPALERFVVVGDEFMPWVEHYKTKLTDDRLKILGAFGQLHFWIDSDGEPHVERVS